MEVRLRGRESERPVFLDTFFPQEAFDSSEHLLDQGSGSVARVSTGRESQVKGLVEAWDTQGILAVSCQFCGGEESGKGCHSPQM